MHKLLKMLLLAAGVVFATACTTTQKRNDYQAYLNTIQSIETSKHVAEAVDTSPYDKLLASCTTDQCVASVASYKAIADITKNLGGGNNNSVRIAAPVREPSFSEKALSWASLLVPGVTSYASIRETNKTQRHLSDNTSAERISQNQMWSSIMSESNTAWSEVASTPNTVVGGNLGTTVTTTNTAGNNLVSGDGNVLGDRNNNSGRQDSLGPIDNSGNCRDGDDLCAINPEPTP